MRPRIPPNSHERLATALARWAEARRLLAQLRSQVAPQPGGRQLAHSPEVARAFEAVGAQERACADLWREVAGLDDELAAARQAPPDTAGLQAQDAGGLDTSSADAPVNVLLVDDETSNLTALEAVLEDPGYRLVRAASGEEALLALFTEDFACLLLDVQMPGMTGLEVASLLKQRQASARTPIIFLTAYDKEEQHALAGYASGAVDYVHKPFDAAVLRQKVDVFADLHRLNRQLHARAAAATARLDSVVQQAERGKDRMLAMFAHELRNPLAPISNAVQILRGPAVPQSTMLWACDVIGRQAGEMARLIDDMLDVAELVHGQAAVGREPLALAGILKAAVEASAPQAHRRAQAIALELPAQAIELKGDGQRLTQAVANVIDNASKFSGPETTIRVTAAYAGGEVRIAVRDDGAGIPPELLPHIFALFVQGEQAIDRPHGGLGLGLARVKHIVESHGGQVAARSAGTGQGTEVLLRLPARLAGIAPSAPTATHPGTGAAAAALRVLVVDDEPASAETLAALLEASGFEARLAGDGPAAIALAEAFLPDVVLLDIGMPGMDGFQVAQHLRAQPHARDALLIALTGYGDADTRWRAMRSGFDLHIAKPADVGRLLQVLADPRAARGSLARPLQAPP